MIRPSLAAVILASGLAVLGCSQKPQPAPTANEGKPATTARQVDADPEPKIVAAVKPVEVQRDRLHQSFTDAVLGPDNPPADVAPPVDKTVTGKSAPRLFEQVA